MNSIMKLKIIILIKYQNARELMKIFLVILKVTWTILLIDPYILNLYIFVHQKFVLN